MPRRLGQHFLKDPRILDRIVDLIDPEPNDVVVEVGSGPGTLTRRLLPRVGSVVSIERDVQLADRLREEGHPNLRVVTGDALRQDWQRLTEADDSPFKVIGNIPYYISTPLIHQALSYHRVRIIGFLVQREVADRVCAVPGTKDYGALSVGVQTFSRASREFTVSAGSFVPRPAVDSAAIRLVPRSEAPLSMDQRDPFRRFVVALFGQRRKRILRVLRNTTTLDVSAAEQVLSEHGIDSDARPEMLEPESLARLFLSVSRWR